MKKRIISMLLFVLILASILPVSASAANSISASDIVSVAKNLVGQYPYVSGGESPSEGGFDCTGLVYYVYHTRLGHEMTLSQARSKSKLLALGTKITDKADFQSGDIIQFTYPHVAIYIGDSKIIESAKSGTYVRESSIENRSDIEYAIRLPEVSQSSSTTSTDNGNQGTADTPSVPTATEYFDCSVRINCVAGQIVNLYNNPGDSSRVTYYSKGQSPGSTYGAKLSDGSVWYQVYAYHNGENRVFWLKYDSSKMTVTDIHTTHTKGDYHGFETEHPHYKVYDCTFCGELFQDTSEPTFDSSCQQCHPEHTWNGGVVTQASTTASTGIMTYTCTTCGETKTEAIPKLIDKCANGHTWNSGVVSAGATSNSTCIKTYTCTVCGATRTEEIPALAASGLANFARVNHYSSNTFRDVASNAWYVGNVTAAYELGLMKGTGENVFSPQNNVTIAETITLAARLHSIYYTGEENFVTYDGGNWYDPYVNYARNNGMLSENYNYTQPATREQFVHILVQALPPEALQSVKEPLSFADAGNITYAGDVQILSCAGVINGSESDGALYFRPTNTITRAEVSAVITRMARAELRTG